MSGNHGRGAATLGAALMTTLLMTAAPAEAAPSPGERIANALRESPVYVDPAYAGSVPPPDRQKLATRIARTGLPIKVVLTPLTKGDAFDGDSDVLAEVVHDRLARRDLILITTDGEFTDTLNGYEWPEDAHQTHDAVATVGFLDAYEDAGLTDRTAKAIELVNEGDGERAYEEATADLSGPAPTGTKPPANPRSTPSSSPPFLTTAAALPLLLLPAGAFALYLFLRGRRRRRHPAAAPFAYPQAVFAAARTADESALRSRAETEVLALGEQTQAADISTPGLQRALDAYAAAGTVLDSARDLADLAGVLALVTEGRDALTPTPTALPLCFFNPLHGRATRHLTWRPVGRPDTARVAACPTCTTAVRTRRAPETLTTTTTDGRRIPYFELPADRSVWAATGYGSLTRDERDSLTARVARGDFTRSIDIDAGPQGR